MVKQFILIKVYPIDKRYNQLQQKVIGPWEQFRGAGEAIVASWVWVDY